MRKIPIIMAKTGVVLSVMATAYFVADKSGLSEWMSGYQRANATATEYLSRPLAEGQRNLASSKYYASGSIALVAGIGAACSLFKKS